MASSTSTRRPVSLTLVPVKQPDGSIGEGRRYVAVGQLPVESLPPAPVSALDESADILAEVAKLLRRSKDPAVSAAGWAVGESAKQEQPHEVAVDAETLRAVGRELSKSDDPIKAMTGESLMQMADAMSPLTEERTPAGDAEYLRRAVTGDFYRSFNPDLDDVFTEFVEAEVAMPSEISSPVWEKWLEAATHADFTTLNGDVMDPAFIKSDATHVAVVCQAGFNPAHAIFYQLKGSMKGRVIGFPSEVAPGCWVTEIDMSKSVRNNSFGQGIEEFQLAISNGFKTKEEFVTGTAGEFQILWGCPAG
jgi:hypothetical protein